MDKIISGWARAKILFLGLARAKITTREKALWAQSVKVVTTPRSKHRLKFNLIGKVPLICTTDLYHIGLKLVKH